jgi:hypothetical protein
MTIKTVVLEAHPLDAPNDTVLIPLNLVDTVQVRESDVVLRVAGSRYSVSVVAWNRATS